MKILQLFVAVILAGFSICSCTDVDTPEDNVVDFEVARMLVSGNVNCGYTLTSVRLFHNDSETNGEWTEVNLREYVGWQAALESEIIILDGSTYAPFRLFHISYGPHPLAAPWDAYCKATKCTKQLYISSPLLLDEENNRIKIGNHWCTLECFTNKTLRVVYESGYLKAATKEVGKSREISTYLANDRLPDPSEMLCFENERDLTIDLLARFRETFGDSVNLNHYLYGVFLEDPIVNFDDLERRLLGDR